MKGHFPLLFGGFLLVAMMSGCRTASFYWGSDFQRTVQETSHEVFPAVVYIRVQVQDTTEGKDSAIHASGSGVLITPDGELLTNHHVIDKAKQIRCRLYDGRSYTAKVIGSDKDLDIALVKLQKASDEPPLPVAKLREDWMREGDFVMAMGAPWGLSRSVSVGIISCARRYLESNGRYTLWYQTDAAIAPGNSGGPLIDTKGRIAGINTLGLRGGGNFGFTIPSPIIRDVLDRIRQYGGVNWAWFGFELQPLHDFDRNINFDFEKGVIVANAEPGSPARLAGFEPNDRILSVNNQPLNALTEEELPEVRRRLGLMPAAVPARFQVMRGKQELTLLATPGEKGEVEGDDLVLPRWGFTAKAINKFDNPSLSFYVPEGGVFVYGLREQGNALRAGLRRQDIILSINGRPVPSLGELSKLYDEAMANLASQSTMTLALLRNGRRMFVALNYATEEKP